MTGAFYPLRSVDNMGRFVRYTIGHATSVWSVVYFWTSSMHLPQKCFHICFRGCDWCNAEFFH